MFSKHFKFCYCNSTAKKSISCHLAEERQTDTFMKMFWIILLYLRPDKLSLIIKVLPRQHWHLAYYLDFTETFFFCNHPHIEQYPLAHKSNEKIKRVVLRFQVFWNGYFNKIFVSIPLMTGGGGGGTTPHIIFLLLLLLRRWIWY